MGEPSSGAPYEPPFEEPGTGEALPDATSTAEAPLVPGADDGGPPRRRRGRRGGRRRRGRRDSFENGGGPAPALPVGGEPFDDEAALAEAAEPALGGPTSERGEGGDGDSRRRKRGSRGGRRRRGGKRSGPAPGGAVAIEVIPGDDDELPELVELPHDAVLVGSQERARPARREEARGRGAERESDEDEDDEPVAAPVPYKKRVILVNARDSEEKRVAVVEDGRIVDLQMTVKKHVSYVNDIYRGRVVNIESAIGAAFVDFGEGKNGFLHASDVLPSYGEPDWNLEKLLSTPVEAKPERSRGGDEHEPEREHAEEHEHERAEAHDHDHGHGDEAHADGEHDHPEAGEDGHAHEHDGGDDHAPEGEHQAVHEDEDEPAGRAAHDDVDDDEDAP
ncbi:MAG: hypothetical protein ABL998_16655, partial [Planctomycetota bacterium]